MPHPSFAFVRLPGDSSHQIRVFTDSPRIVPQPIVVLNDTNSPDRFVFSPWNDSDRLYIWSDFQGVFTLGEVSQNIKHLHKRPFLTPSTSFEQYERGINLAKDHMESGDLTKVVLARELIKPQEVDWDVCMNLFERLCGAHPQAFVYVCSSENWGTWMGASPETLVRYENGEAHVMSLAGTLFNEGESWSAKERAEQSVTSDFIRACLNWQASDAVEIRELHQGGLRHLLSIYRKSWPRNLLAQLLQELSPTPAVCGSPRTQAAAFIAKEEGFLRDLYAGFMGVQQGDRFLSNVNLRCAEIGTDGIRLLAGCGINKESAADREWQESALKMSVIGEYLS
jgi:isochorismate synthase